MTRLVRTARVALVVAALALAVSFGFSRATPTHAYGAENWQTTFAGTGVAPGTGFGFGFWGWCAFGGGVTDGNDGDCQFSNYFHAPAGGGFTCEVSLDISSWSAASGTFVITGTATVNPTSLTAPCVTGFPGGTSFTGVDSGIPAATGHYDLGGLGPGLRGEFMIQVTQIP
jgi:hypothetical protein